MVESFSSAQDTFNATLSMSVLPYYIFVLLDACLITSSLCDDCLPRVTCGLAFGFKVLLHQTNSLQWLLCAV